MPFFLATILLQVACVAHLMRTRRNQAWLLAILLLPVVGSLAYVVVVVAPGGRR